MRTITVTFIDWRHKMEFNINEMLISPELVRNMTRHFLLWFWCCVPASYALTLINNYFEGSEND